MGLSDGLEFQRERKIAGQDLSWWASAFFSLSIKHVLIMWSFVFVNNKKSLKSFQDNEVTTCSDGTFGTKRYFTCEGNKALFVPLTNCKPDSRFLFIPNEIPKPLEPPSGETLQSALLFLHLQKHSECWRPKNDDLFSLLSHTPGRFKWRCSPCCWARCFVPSDWQNEGNPRSLQLLLSRCHSL